MTNLAILDQAKSKFELACKEASTLQLVNNFTAAFTAVNVVNLLREAMTDEVMNQVFMPLMNTKVGFLTDRSGKPNSKGEIKKPYSVDVVRDSIIDGISIGLLPTGNQMNIIADRMYPTKEGYTALLRKLGVKYFIDVSYDKGQTPSFAEIPCKISYEQNGEKNSFSIIATVKKDSYSSHDQLRGKAERKAKKALYEYITGCDFGDADPDATVENATYTDVTNEEKLKTDLSSSANKEEFTLSGNMARTESRYEPPKSNPVQSQEKPSWMR